MKAHVTALAAALLLAGAATAGADLTTDGCLPGYRPAAVAGVPGCRNPATGSFYLIPLTAAEAPVGEAEVEAQPEGAATPAEGGEAPAAGGPEPETERGEGAPRPSPGGAIINIGR